MGGQVVLYVEDDNAAFTVVSIIMQEHNAGIQLVRARDGEEALAVLRRCASGEEASTPDLILLDLNLPGKSGLEVLSELKGHKLLRAVPVVMFSTSTSVRDRNDALEGGADAYINKPSSFEALVGALHLAFCSLDKR